MISPTNVASWAGSLNQIDSSPRISSRLVISRTPWCVQNVTRLPCCPLQRLPGQLPDKLRDQDDDDDVEDREQQLAAVLGVEPDQLHAEQLQGPVRADELNPLAGLAMISVRAVGVAAGCVDAAPGRPKRAAKRCSTQVLALQWDRSDGITGAAGRGKPYRARSTFDNGRLPRRRQKPNPPGIGTCPPVGTRIGPTGDAGAALAAPRAAPAATCCCRFASSGESRNVTPSSNQSAA